MNFNSGPKEGIPSICTYAGASEFPQGRAFQAPSLLDAAWSPNPATSCAWIALDWEQPSLPPDFALAQAPSRTICILKDRCVLDEGHIPGMLCKAPVTQESRVDVRRTILPGGSQARRLPPPRPTATTKYLKAPL